MERRVVGEGGVTKREERKEAGGRKGGREEGGEEIQLRVYQVKRQPQQIDIAISIMAECTCVVESLIPGWNLQANVGVDTWRERGVNNQNVWRHH